MKVVITLKYLHKPLIIMIISILMIFCTAVNSSAFVDVTISDGEVTLEDKTSSGTKITSKEEGFKQIIESYKSFITFVGGLATMTFILIFIKHFVELGAKASNPAERKQITSGLLWSGIAAGLLGSVTFVFAVMYGVFK